MMTTNVRSAAVAGFLVALVALVGCSTNEAATNTCKESPTCEECCKAAGASGHAKATIEGKYTCKCLGGH